MNKSLRKYLSSIGRKGGKSRSVAKAQAARENGRKRKVKHGA